MNESLENLYSRGSPSSERAWVSKDRPRNTNFCEEFVHHEFSPKNCRKGGKCRAKGARLYFHLVFKPFRRRLGEHQVLVALNGTQLYLNLEPLKARKLLPMNDIPYKVQVKTETKGSQGIKTSLKNIIECGMGEESGEISDNTFCQVQWGGSLSQPICTLESKQKYFIGRMKKPLECALASEEQEVCRCEFNLIATEANFVHDVIMHKNTGVLENFFVKPKMERYATILRRWIASVIEEQYEGVLAKGKWRCSAQK